MLSRNCTWEHLRKKMLEKRKGEKYCFCKETVKDSLPPLVGLKNQAAWIRTLADVYHQVYLH